MYTLASLIFWVVKILKQSSENEQEAQWAYIPHLSCWPHGFTEDLLKGFFYYKSMGANGLPSSTVATLALRGIVGRVYIGEH